MVNIQDSSSGKTSRAPLVQTKDMILDPCLNRSQKPIFQCLEAERGQSPGWSNCKAVKLRGEPSALVIGEYPSVARESSLSAILEVNAPEKYYLSAKACTGILHRAMKRGKELPEPLKNALMEQANLTQADLERLAPETGSEGSKRSE